MNVELDWSDPNKLIRRDGAEVIACGGTHNGPRTTSHWAVTKLDGEPVNYDEYWRTGRYPHDGMTQYDIVYREGKRCQLHEDLKKALGVVSQLQQDNAALEERTSKLKKQRDYAERMHRLTQGLYCDGQTERAALQAQLEQQRVLVSELRANIGNLHEQKQAILRRVQELMNIQEQRAKQLFDETKKDFDKPNAGVSGSWFTGFTGEK